MLLTAGTKKINITLIKQEYRDKSIRVFMGVLMKVLLYITSLFSDVEDLRRWGLFVCGTLCG
jgi:hypothetical protein